MQPKPSMLIAFGGNALIQKGQDGTAEEQFANLKVPMRQIARLSRSYRVVITHGNGPQAGNILLQQESTAEVPDMPLEIIVAMTQGQIGYMIESSLDRALVEIGIVHEQLFVTLITYVVVDEQDPAVQNPTKPIGPFYTEEQAGGCPTPWSRRTRATGAWWPPRSRSRIVQHREIKTADRDGLHRHLLRRRRHPGDPQGTQVPGGGRRHRQGPGELGPRGRDPGGRLRHRLGCAGGFGRLGEARPAAAAAKSPQPNWSATWRKASSRPAPWGPRCRPLFSFTEATGKRGIICHLEEIERALAGEAGTEIV